MTRRLAAALLLPAALAGWALLALLGWLIWTHPAAAFLLLSSCVLAAAVRPGRPVGSALSAEERGSSRGVFTS